MQQVAYWLCLGEELVGIFISFLWLQTSLFHVVYLDAMCFKVQIVISMDVVFSPAEACLDWEF